MHHCPAMSNRLHGGFENKVGSIRSNDPGSESGEKERKKLTARDTERETENGVENREFVL